MLGINNLENPIRPNTSQLGKLFPRLTQTDLTWKPDEDGPAQFVSAVLTQKGHVILSDDEHQGLDLPSGAIEKTDQSPESAMRRELQEELGTTPTELFRFGTVTVPDQAFPHSVALFIAQANKIPGSEDTRIVPLPIQDALDLLPTGLSNLRDALRIKLADQIDLYAHTGFGFNVNYDVQADGTLTREIQYTDS